MSFLVNISFEKQDFNFVQIDKLGSYKKDDTYLHKHIEAIINYDMGC